MNSIERSKEFIGCPSAPNSVERPIILTLYVGVQQHKAKSDSYLDFNFNF